MATITPGRTSRRPGSFRGVLVFLVRNGRIYAQKWPRKRGRSKLPWQRAATDRMRVLNRAIKSIPADQRATMQEALREFLDANRGVRGTAAIRERDLQTTLLSGRLWQYSAPGVRRLPTMVQVQDASDILDQLEPYIGSMLTRTNDTWLPTLNCRPGRVCCLLPSVPLPNACPPAQHAPKQHAMGGFD